MRVDLHVHTTASDGTLTPEELVVHALNAAIDVVAIADHDTVDGVLPAMNAAAGSALDVIPAVELSCEADGHGLHLLGYFIDLHHRPLLARLETLRQERMERARRMVEALVRGGYTLEMGDVLRAAGDGAVGRSHVARALVERGHARSVWDAFDRMLGRGRPFFVSRQPLQPEDAVALIRSAGGCAVVAHPGVSGVEPVLDRLVAAGICGLEAFHAEQDAAQRGHWSRLARRRGLIATGGSDYHGPGSAGARLGDAEVPDGTVERLREAAAAR